MANGDHADVFILAREALESRIRSAVLATQAFDYGLFVGSVPAGTADIFSDIDVYLYSEGADWTRDRVAEWLAECGCRPDVHYWTGIEKHRLVIDGVRVDLSILKSIAIQEIRGWPHLFFDRSAIIKDSDGRLEGIIVAHRSRVASIPENDRAAFVVNLLAVAAQFARGEVLNARSRLTGVLEARARMGAGEPIGTALWRESTRHAEDRLPMSTLRDLYAVAFLRSPASMRDWLVTELLEIASDEALEHATGSAAAYLAHRIAAMRHFGFEVPSGG